MVRKISCAVTQQQRKKEKQENWSEIFRTSQNKETWWRTINVHFSKPVFSHFLSSPTYNGRQLTALYPVVAAVIHIPHNRWCSFTSWGMNKQNWVDALTDRHIPGPNGNLSKLTHYAAMTEFVFLENFKEWVNVLACYGSSTLDWIFPSHFLLFLYIYFFFSHDLI